MERIVGSTKNVTNEDLEDMITDMGIPYVDLGAGPKTVRHTGPNGEIVDEVVSSGEKGFSESWEIKNIGPAATKHDSKREAARFKEHIEKHPLNTLE